MANKPDGYDEIEQAQEEEEVERKYRATNTARPGERWCPADFMYDPLSKEGFE